MNNRSYSGIFYFFSISVILSLLILPLSHNASAADDASIFSKKIEGISARLAVKLAVKNISRTKNLDSSENNCYELAASFGDVRLFFESLESIKKEGVFRSSEISSIESVKDERGRISNCKIFVIKSLRGEPDHDAEKRSRIYENKFQLLKDMIGGAQNFGVSITGFYYLPDLKIEISGNSAKLDSILQYAYAGADSGNIQSFSEFSAKAVYSRDLGVYYYSFRLSAVMK